MTHTSTKQPEAQRFTKKPVTIVATQWFKSGDHPAVRDISDSDELFFTGMGGATLVEREKFGVIGTLESPNHLVTPGDWIITGVQGEHYPCKPDIFEATYTPEGLMSEKLTTKPAAAPVQMPEPFTTLVRKKSWSTNCYEAAALDNHRDYGRSWADERVQVYTEQQVRDLLAEVSVPAAPDVSALVEALEMISDTDPDEGTAWFHEVACKALAAHRKQGGGQ